MFDTRRAALAAAAVVALVALAGCGAFTSGGETTLLLVNNDETSHDVTIEVVDGDDVVFEEQQSVEPDTDNEFGTLSETGEYTVLVTVDDRTTRLSYEFTEGDDTVSIGIDNDGNVFVSA